MQTSMMLRPELDPGWAALSYDERREIEVWLRLVRRIETATDKTAEVQRIIRDYGHLRGVSQSTLYRKRDLWRRHGVAGLMRRSRHVRGVRVGLPTEFVQWLQGRCGLNQRAKFAAVYRHLFCDWLLAGKMIPGYDADWRGIWSAENGRDAPAECPYRLHDATPRGWSYRQLLRHCPDDDAWAGASIGPWAASAYLPKVPHTRVGLELGQIYVIDDVEHDFRVNFPGQLDAQRPVEVGALELLTGRYASWGLCPVRERADGSREKLKESYVRYLIVDLLCRVGVHPDGVLILSEHGTAAIREELLGRIHAAVGDSRLFRVEAGSVFGAPLVAGLLAARPRGNPRWKAALESHHNLKHNELAMLPGQVGMDRDHHPEETAAKDRENRALTLAATALARTRPDLAERLSRPYVAWQDFCLALTELYRRIDYRQRHELEGYAECGFTAQEIRLDESLPWMPVEKLDAMEPAARSAALALVGSRPGLATCRLLSPAEAWAVAERRTPLRRYPLSVAAHVLGPELSQVREVERDGTVQVAIEGQRKTVRYLAQARNDAGWDVAITRGRKVRLWVNPINYQQALCADLDGRWIGVLPGMLATTHGDREAEQRNLGLRQKAVAERARRLAATLDGQLERRMEQVAEAAEVLLDSDPALDAAQADADRAALASAAPRRSATVEDWPVEDLGPASWDRADADAGVALEDLEALCASGR